MTRTIFDLTDDEKAAIRAIEIAGLLHNMGKLTDEFVRSQAERGKDNGEFEYLTVAKPGDVFSAAVMERIVALPADSKGKEDVLKHRLAPANPLPDATDIQDFTASLRPAKAKFWDDQELNLAEILLLATPDVYYRYRRAPDEYKALFEHEMKPARLVGLLHSIVHFEKDDPAMGSTGKKQKAGTGFSSSAFGHETAISPLGDLYKALPLALLQTAIQDAESYRALDGSLESSLLQGLGHTARPINEVSLWDWSYMVSAFAKAAAAQIFIDGWPDDGDLGALRFQTVRVSLNRLEAMTHSDRVSDLLGVRRTIDDSYGKVRTLFESELAFGKQIYADETGAIFLCPVFKMETSELRARIGALFPNDLQPRVYASEAITATDLGSFRGRNKAEETVEAFAQAQTGYYAGRKQKIAGLVAHPRRAAQAEAPVQPEQPVQDWLAAWIGGNGHDELCTVCRMRPVGYPRAGYEVEGVTLGSWASTSKARERHICRVCLDRRGRQSDEWLRNEKGERNNTIWTDEVADDSGRLALLVGRLPLDEWLDGTLLDTLMLHRGTGGAIAKNASPARLYRIAEDGRDFWQTMVDVTVPEVVGERPYRLKLTPADSGTLTLDRNNTYEVVFDDFALQAVWAGDHFVSVENLAGLLRRQKKTTQAKEGDGLMMDSLIEAMRRKPATVRSPSGFLQAGEDKVSGVALTDVEPIDRGYFPHIKLMAEPGLAMALVPASKAMAAATAIHEKYIERFGRVADRLPLHLGLVYFRRRTPLPAVLDAARRFLELPPADWEPWRVTVENRMATFSDDAGRCFTHAYSAHMGDGQTPDEWYPYLATAKPASGAAIPVAYIDEIQPKTTVYIRPGYFDYEYLDTAGRRYEIAYEAAGRRATRLARPFLLAELNDLEATWRMFEQGLEESQRYQVIGLIEDARESWFGDEDSTALRQRVADTTFTGFVSHTLRSANWKKGKRPSNFDALINAAAAGQLADLAEIHLGIMAKASD